MKEVGEGAEGLATIAEDKQSGAWVMVKSHKKAAEDPETPFRTYMSFSHPHILPVVDYFKSETDPHFSIVSKIIHSGDLDFQI